MSRHPTTLLQMDTGQKVPATLEDEVSLLELLDAEAAWSPHRIAMIRSLITSGRNPPDVAESLHWNWANKVARLGPGSLGGLSPYRAFGVESNQWQGVLLANSMGHLTKVGTKGLDLAYVELIETAPWNWDIAGLQNGLFRGVGIQLMESVVRWSRSLKLEGRVGLHSLQQSENFYRKRCGMTDLGPDPGYGNLRYFEMTEDQARVLLKEKKP